MAKTKPNTLARGRPPLSRIDQRASTLVGSSANINARKKSSKATRTLINKHHQLHKARASALAAQDQSLVQELDQQIEELGGLATYQAASLTGQDKDRGGDSSEKLVEWLRQHGLVGERCATTDQLRVLEVGALSSRNAISGMLGKGVREVKRIDLHSQEPELIEEADFMSFPVPSTDSDKYDLLSLSLVLNYVPDAVQRGEMLRRTSRFLKSSDGGLKPLLFLVLPLPCLTNSRYMTHAHLFAIMKSLGYEVVESHDSTKLAYVLFRCCNPPDDAQQSQAFKKMEINPGRSRNNFAVIVEPRR